MHIIPSEKELEDMFRNGQIPLATIHYTLPAGYSFIRARYHDSDKVPRTVSDINYPPNPETISLGRANDWGQQVFYGMLGSGNMDLRLAAYQEIGDEGDPLPTFTISRWELRKDLVGVMSLIMHESQTKANQFAKVTYEHNMSYLRDLPDSIKSRCKDALDEVGRQFSRVIKDCSYSRTARFANFCFSNGFNAIIYPSVAYQYKAICIAMPKHIADEHLHPISGGLTQIHVNQNTADECCYKTFRVRGSDLIWEDYENSGPPRPPFAQSSIPKRENPCAKLRPPKA